MPDRESVSASGNLSRYSMNYARLPNLESGALRSWIRDAKYYEASTVANAPGWPDLVKQFYYADAVKKISGDKASITNHFIFPGSCNYLKSAHVAPRESEVKSELECYTDYPKIHCHYLEPELLVKKYYKGSKLEAFSKFILGL